jgi:hypothetical protein
MNPAFSNPVQWQQNVGYARDICARLFRDGGTPADALRTFGLAADAAASWSAAVDRIAGALSTPGASTQRRAA